MLPRTTSPEGCTGFEGAARMHAWALALAIDLSASSAPGPGLPGQAARQPPLELLSCLPPALINLWLRSLNYFAALHIPTAEQDDRARGRRRTRGARTDGAPASAHCYRRRCRGRYAAGQECGRRCFNLRRQQGRRLQGDEEEGGGYRWRRVVSTLVLPGACRQLHGSSGQGLSNRASIVATHQTDEEEAAYPGP
jgi:hypothetical protein